MTFSYLCTLMPSLTLSNANERQSQVPEAGSRELSDAVGRKHAIVELGKHPVVRSPCAPPPAQHDSLSSASAS